MASRKEEIYQALQGGIYSFRLEAQEFVNTLMHYKVPMALVSTCPKKYIEIAIGTICFEWTFSVIVATEDVHRGKPDLEIFVYTSQLSEFSEFLMEMGTCLLEKIALNGDGESGARLKNRVNKWKVKQQGEEVESQQIEK
ncbi:5-amino-6-(5-phospho-D-ribitylamino)uracil phosphatase, chloroplastic isoform X3 [Capsicum annuum]|uniref:5-amino-6-(5-phospho-D-ribitylamino)uracil phosphatase, chloroplastic isoform X3 n=1 Tax=Capsicum annuum TaxID=4072 RepID=UPI001FB15739|nr:5-amino-6-(5-phospho-D-ribitylamino)uracil phosphatase, chloroplastic isoform X3 [Capsicum annuum]XP_047264413.1 5-amino-6-(5-phospho-D-ribitylamino)uracil phosphatase, chloroplastic isoform X3 [Capsicum annuum]